MNEPKTTRAASLQTGGPGRPQEKVEKEEKVPRRDTGQGRTARDATGINPKDTEPVDPKMPDMPPA
jgi:hypothetical protein